MTLFENQEEVNSGYHKKKLILYYYLLTPIST